MASTTLAQYVGADEADADFVAECEARAEKLIEDYIGPKLIGAGKVPEIIIRSAVLEVGADLYHRRSARNGIQTFGAGLDLTPIRVRSDQLASARPILAPYLGPGIA